MEDFKELILYENENIRLDFKRDEYRKENYSSLLKDILSMANAFTKEDRFIIIGLKPKSIDDRGFKGIEGELTDAAIFQQLVYENIEPEIEISYFPYKFANYLLGILKISNCCNPPYLMKKDYGNGNYKLHRGEGYIRKGTHQTRLTLEDYNRYTQNKIQEKYFTDEVIFNLKTPHSTNEIELISVDEIKRPSQIQKDRIERILNKKRFEVEQYKKMGIKDTTLYNFGNSFKNINAMISGTGIPYEDRDIPTLEENLKEVEDTYLEDDYYEFFEMQTNKCNITIFNKGHKYIEDAFLMLKIPKVEGLLVLDKIHSKPNRNPMTGNIGISKIYYPKVSENEEFYTVESSIGDIKHQLFTQAFGYELRIFASTKMKIDSFKIVCELFAKNIKTSIYQEIEIKTRKKNPDSNV